MSAAMLAPATALAVEVECTDENGTCTVSNNGFDSVDCECGEVASGSTGANVWDGLNEAELTEVCLEQLELCAPFDTDGMTTGVGTVSVSTTTVGTDSDSDSVGVTGDPTDSTTGDTDSGVTGDPPVETSTGIVIPTTGGEPEPPEDDGDTTGGASLTGASASGTSPEPTAGGSSGGDDEGTPEDNGESSGCGCNSSEGGGPLALVALLGLLGLRRRRLGLR